MASQGQNPCKERSERLLPRPFWWAGTVCNRFRLTMPAPSATHFHSLRHRLRKINAHYTQTIEGSSPSLVSSIFLTSLSICRKPARTSPQREARLERRPDVEELSVHQGEHSGRETPPVAVSCRTVAPTVKVAESSSTRSNSPSIEPRFCHSSGIPLVGTTVHTSPSRSSEFSFLQSGSSDNAGVPRPPHPTTSHPKVESMQSCFLIGRFLGINPRQCETG